MVRGKGIPAGLGLGLALLLAATPVGAQQGQGGQQQQSATQGQGQQRGSQTQDQMLAEMIFLRLAASPSLAGSNIQVSVQQGTAMLRGAVASEGAKRRAVRIAWWTPGIQDVRDQQLRVDQSLAQQAQRNIQDDKLAAQITQKLARETFPNASTNERWLYGWEIEGPNWEFDVEVDDGQVTLDGEVASTRAIVRAVEAAHQVPGVRSVIAELRVRDGFEGRYGMRRGYSPYAGWGSYGARGPYGAYGPYGTPYGPPYTPGGAPPEGRAG